MRRPTQLLLSGVLAAALVSHAAAQIGQRTYVVTTETGSYLMTETGVGTPGNGLGGTDDIRWAYNHSRSIPWTVALCPFGNSAWAGQGLNAERMQRFVITGAGTPNLEVPAGPRSKVAVAAAKNADLGAFLDTEPSLVLQVYDSAGMTPLWVHSFPSNFNQSTWRGTRIARDGSVVACYVFDRPARNSELHFFDGPTGTPLSVWRYADPRDSATALDLTDDGSLCFVTMLGGIGRLIDVATATEIFTAAGSGGSIVHHKISGDGEVLVLGGTRFEVYIKTGPSYTRVLNFSDPPLWWFGQGTAVSRDGSTVAAASYDRVSYLNTSTRIWDVATLALLGQHDTFGLGRFQDAIMHAAMSDDGSVLAVGSWGTEFHDHPEVMIFDRNANLIDGIDTAGSVFGMDLSGDGIYVLSGSRSVHANMGGAGGTVTLYGCEPCDINCDGIVDAFDIEPFIDLLFTGGNPCNLCTGDVNGDGMIDALDIEGFIACLYR